MARYDDVSALLAEGREAAMHTQTYVSACQRTGYRNPELTGYAGQLMDRYDSEAGLDLRLLDADCAAVRALADAAADALRLQRGQLAELSRAWQGPGGAAATDFLRRHCDAGAELVARLGAAATACAALRDELGRLIDAKVTTALAVDDRVAAQRPSWLAAAHAVNAGNAGEPATEIILKQVVPYVDHDVRGEWLAAMRAAQDGVVTAYGTAISAADPGAGVAFALPGESLMVQPDWPPRATTMTGAPPGVVPDRVRAPLLEPTPPDPAVGDRSPAGPLESLPEGMGLPSGLGLPGGLGMPSTGFPAGGGGGLGGLSGLIPRLADALGASEGPLGDPFDGPAPTDEAADSSDDRAEPDSDDPGETDSAAEESGEEGLRSAAEQQAEAVSEPEAVSSPEDVEAVPEPVNQTQPRTPCEVAAEELPQVGQ